MNKLATVEERLELMKEVFDYVSEHLSNDKIEMTRVFIHYVQTGEPRLPGVGTLDLEDLMTVMEN